MMGDLKSLECVRVAKSNVGESPGMMLSASKKTLVL